MKKLFIIITFALILISLVLGSAVYAQTPAPTTPSLSKDQLLQTPPPGANMPMSLPPVSQNVDYNLPSVSILPDSSFYFLVGIYEKLQDIFSIGDERKAALYLKLADKRIVQAEKMANKGKIDLAMKFLEKYQDLINRAQEKMAAKKDKKSVKKLLEKAELSTQKHQAVLERVKEKVPSQAQQGIDRAIESSQKGHQEILELQGESQQQPFQPQTIKGRGRMNIEGDDRVPPPLRQDNQERGQRMPRDTAPTTPQR